MSTDIQNEKYEKLFKNLKTKESAYEFFLRAQSALKKELQKNHNPIDFLSLLYYEINHLKQLNEKESINSLLSFSFEIFTNKFPTLQNNIKVDIIKKYTDIYFLYPGLPNSNNFRMKFLYYCKKNIIDEKILRELKCFDKFAQESIMSGEYVDAYILVVKSENIKLFFEFFDILEKLNNKDEKQISQILKDNNPFSRNKVLFKGFQFDILILRTTLELIINKNLQLANQFISKYYYQYNYNQNEEKQNIYINFAYLLVTLLIKEPNNYDYFWALINLYKEISKKYYDIQFYLNQISINYFNKSFIEKK